MKYVFCSHGKLGSTFPISYVVGSKEKPYIITEDVIYSLSDGSKYIVRKGFRLDGTSVPRWLRSLMPRINNKIIGSTLHDNMYVYDHKRDELGDYEARKLADNEMLHFWNKYDNERKRENKIMYYIVRKLGRKTFLKKNNENG